MMNQNNKNLHHHQNSLVDNGAQVGGKSKERLKHKQVLKFPFTNSLCILTQYVVDTLKSFLLKVEII